jgi:hypothetical protein
MGPVEVPELDPRPAENRPGKFRRGGKEGTMIVLAILIPTVVISITVTVAIRITRK